MRELEGRMTPTGNTFTGTINDNIGSFSIKGKLSNKIVELSADGYFFNEVSGSLSSAKLTLSAVILRLQASSHITSNGEANYANLSATVQVTNVDNESSD